MDTKKAMIIFASPHKDGGTNEITVWAEQRLTEMGFQWERVHLYGKTVKPCIGCGVCQTPEEAFGCIQKDDVPTIAEQVMRADLILLATPIHGSYCAAPLKTLLDRLVYMMNKYVGRPPEDWHAFGDSKHLVVLISYGVQYDDMLVPLDVGMQMYCTHSSLFYDGYVAVHRKNFVRRGQSGDEAQFGDRARVIALIDRAAAACREGRKADWDAKTGMKKGG